MKILAVECADKAASCAIVEDGRTVCESVVSAGLTHSRTLMPMVESMLKNSELKISDVDLFAVTVGPGSFTGLRIGIACVKGMAFGLNKPCRGVSTLLAAAYPLKDRKGIVCAVMDARCDQVYNALFESDGSTLRRLCDDRALMCDELEKELGSIKAARPDTDIILVGSGSRLCLERFGQKLGLTTVSDIISTARASSVALAAQNETSVSADRLMPSYLRLPQAERELNAKLSRTKQEDE